MTKRDTILIVDDMEVNRAILRSMFEKNYNLLEAENGEQAIFLAKEYHEQIAAVLLDVVMPVKDGYQVMEEAGRMGLLHEFPVIVITAEDSVESEVHAFDLGASDIIMKPFEPHVVKRRVQNSVELNLHRLNQEELIEEQASKLRESNELLVDTLSSIIEYRSVETGQHIQRIRMFTQVLLEEVAVSYPEFGLNERTIGIISSASSLHDIGKIAIPDSILNKPGKLTKEEFEIMKTHSLKGCEILEGLNRMSDKEYLEYAYNICRYHHERWDGRGYPDGLKGDRIPVCAQVVGIADCYDALTTDRVYKKAIDPEQAFNMILNGECGTFSPKLLECFKNVRMPFAQLTREYADGNMPDKNYKPKHVKSYRHQEDGLNTLQLGQIKYFTLLRYMDATAIEVDFNTGMYHLVYLSSRNFEQLKIGNRFEDSLKEFISHCVHPEDQERALEMTGPRVEEFFREGWSRKGIRYRVYNLAAGDYVCCEVTMLRIDTASPHDKKALFIWKELKESECSEKMGSLTYKDQVLGGMIGGFQQCLNNQNMTMLYYNKGFQELTGYTETEIKEKFHNQYLEMIYPADRREVTYQMREQLKQGNRLELEYRIRAKADKVIWILEKRQLVIDEQGQESFFCLLIDVTQSKMAQEELRLSLERHKIIMDQTNDIIFEWNIKSDKISYSFNWEKKFGYPPIEEEVSRKIPKASHVHPEDLPEFKRLIKNMTGGAGYEEIQFRLADNKGRYRWCKIRATAQVNSQGEPVKAVGIVTDIDKEKRISQQLRDRAEKDSLTELYNKNTGRKLVEKWIESQHEGRNGAIYMIDVDDFKQINERYGHLFGDAVLQGISSELRKIFRDDEIISRIGGDEFMIFVKDLSDKEEVLEKGKEILLSFQKMFHHNVISYQPSCSIGVAVFPDDGRDFETLFQNSDLALYCAKSEGKDRLVLYDQTQMSGSFYLSQYRMTTNTRIESDDAKQEEEKDLVEEAFKKLYQNRKLDDGIYAIMEMIGRRFNVSRVCIFEDSEDGTRFSNTYEWCNEGIIPQIDLLQNVSYEDLGGNYKDAFSEEGFFYCQDISQLSAEQYALVEPQGIKSMLQCAIFDGGEIRGWIGFDDCLIRRMWTQEQIEVLGFVARLLSNFLLRQRSQERVKQEVKNLKKVLDLQDACICVVDAKSYEILYLNKKMRMLTPEEKEDMLCYQTLSEQSLPHKQCPMQWGRKDAYMITFKESDTI